MKKLIVALLVAMSLSGTVKANEVFEEVEFEEVAFEESDELSAGWETDGRYWIFTENDSVLTGFQKLGNCIYYFDAFGVMKTGWIMADGSWYFADASGHIQTNGMFKIGNCWYCFDANGKMMTGFNTIYNNGVYKGTYFFSEKDGHRQSGWLLYNGFWYWLSTGSDTGRVCSGWQRIGNCTYYFDGKGVMVTGNYTIDGKVRVFDSNGHLVR